MSSPRYRLRLSPQASEDLRDILQYSLDRWGEEQQQRYAGLLERALITLQDHPNSGRARPDLWPECRALVVEQHVILYQITGRRIRVARILSRRRDLRRAVRESP